MKAFPRKNKITPDDLGMDLRDYFAAKALNSFLLRLTEDYVMSDVASDCYCVADEMMKARNDS
jgi:hypothetical protein